jgi:hypothetical protein
MHSNQVVIVAAGLAAALLASGARAGLITEFSPSDAPHVNSPPFGPVSPGGVITTEYVGFGVDFTSFNGSPDVAVFDDPPEAWTGVNDAGIVDLLTDTFGRIVMPGTTRQGTTDMIQIEAGLLLSDDGLVLEVFDVVGALIGATIFDDGVGPNGRRLAMLDVDGIASFRVTTPLDDHYGINTIWLGEIIPAPASLAAMVIGSGFACLRRRRRLGVVRREGSPGSD